MDRWTEWDEGDEVEVIPTEIWRLAMTVLALGIAAAAVCQPQPVKVPDRSGAAPSARATVGRLERGEGFVLVPTTDADAYALEEAIGRDVVVEVRR